MRPPQIGSIEICDSRVLKQDSSFQLQRLGTRSGERFLVKFAVVDGTGTHETLLEQEFQLFRSVRSPQVLSPLRLDRVGEKLVAYYEDLEGKPLHFEVAPAAFDAVVFVALVNSICSILESFHAEGVILVGVAPDSFLMHCSNDKLTLADAPFAQVIGSHSKYSEQYWIRSSYLAYAAPEAVGHDSLCLDVRADLYALGALLYASVSGRPPFEATDPAELIQSHLAKQPRSLSDLGSGVPGWVDKLILKLLAKSPQERYANVDGVRAALARGIASGDVAESRRILERTQFRVLSLSKKLWGRDESIRILAEKLQQARSSPDIVIIEGAPGIGKSALFLEVQNLHAADHCCRGKFNQAGPVTPLSGWAAALKDLANVVLTRNTAELEAWRQKILGALGEWASLISALVPEWNTVLRLPPRPSDDSLENSLNRLAMAIHRLFGCFAEASVPVVLLLDDLQWADASSLRILELVLTIPEPLNLLVMVALRSSNEQNAGHPVLREWRENLIADGLEVETLNLDSLNSHELQGFLEDSFGGRLRAPREFSRLVLRKTQGNPFFVREFLKVLFLKQAIYADPSTLMWCWEERVIHSFPVAENVVTFLSGRIRALPEEVMAALGVAGCMGIEFRLSDLCAVMNLRPDLVLRYLEVAVQEGLLHSREASSELGTATAGTDEGPTDTQYEFVHDRVLEACRALTSANERAALSLHIGRALSRRSAGRPSGSGHYELAEYFNSACQLIVSKDERYFSAELDLCAGRLAKSRGAFSQALSYFTAGLDFLQPIDARDPEASAWHERLELTRGLHEEAAEAALLNRQFELMHALCDTILLYVHEPLQKVLTYDIRICGYKAEKKFSVAVDAALQILKDLGIRFPKTPGLFHIVTGYLATKRRIFGGPVERLAQLSTLQEPTIKAVSRIIQSVYPAAYLARPNLFPLLVFRHVNDSLQYGNEDYSAATYCAFAIVLSAMGDFDNAVRLGEIGLGLLKRFEAERLKARVFMAYYTFVFPWKHHIRDTEPYYRDAIQAGLEHGDFEYACYTMGAQSLVRLYSGSPLPESAAECERYRALITSLGHERSILLQDMLCQAIVDLRDGTPESGALSGSIYEQDRALPRCLDPLDQNLVFHNHMVRMVISTYLGSKQDAADAATLGRLHLNAGAFGNYIGAVFAFYDSMVILNFAGSTSPSRSLMLRVGRSQRRLAKWARSAPMNFLHRYYLVEAERCRVRGRMDRATQYYERAIELAQAHGYLHETGLAQERAAAFYLERGMSRLGRYYLCGSHQSYRRWGAVAVARRLETEYAQHFALLVANSDGSEGTMVSGFKDSLDYRMLLKSSQAISSEVFLPRLIERLLKTILEHAGAQRGLLILERRGQLLVEAEADVDCEQVKFPTGENVETTALLCRAIAHFVARTEAPVVLVDAANEGLFSGDPYVLLHQPKSLLCTPILYQGRLLGLAYLENSRVSHVFTRSRLELVNLLAGQAAISIANARFHALELEAVQARVNPHFLFNVLSSIADLAVADGAKAEAAIIKLARLYQYILTNTSNDMVSLNQELQVVRHYLELEKLRFGAQLEFSVETLGDPTGVRLPGLLIQPLVENCIRHAIAPRLTPGHVWVRITVHDGRCSVVVEDDGDGANHGTAGTGFGLKSVQQRLALSYGTGYSLAMTRPRGYRVEIEIPLSPNG